MTLALKRHCAWAVLLGTLFGRHVFPAQAVTVTGRVSLVARVGESTATGNADVVVWLEPLPGAARESAMTSPATPVRQEPAWRPDGRYQLLQKNKRFLPHMLVVPLGAVVEFPNRDPFFHNVFSMFEGKRFDLGLYEAGSTRTVTFNKPGVSYIFCNIHPEMSAVIIVTGTPYYAISNRAGEITINGVQAGAYRLEVWAERCLPESLKALDREIDVSPSSSSFGELRLPESGDLLIKHKNKYGRDYDPADPSSPYGVH